MFTKRILFLTNSRLLSVVWRRGRVLDRQIFSPAQEGVDEFTRHVAEMPRFPAYLLTELVEEDFRSDTIPHVIARDRRAILERKLAQIYRATPYRLGLVQGRESEGRRDDRVLYTAITNPELVRVWVEVLLRQKIPLAGVFSAPLISADLLKALKLQAPHVLLVSIESGGGLRQSYFQNREIKFSRLTPVGELTADELPALISDEVGRTWQYLDSLRYFTRADVLDVYLLAHAEDHAAILATRPLVAQIHYNVIDLKLVAARIGLAEAPAHSDATPIFIHLMGRGRGMRQQFASGDETYGMRIWKSRVALYGGAALVLLASGLWGAVATMRTIEASAAMTRIDAQTQSVAREHGVALAKLPPSPVSPAVMRDSVLFHAALTKISPTPTAMLRDLSQVLAVFPRVRLRELHWGIAADRETLLDYQPPIGEQGALRTSRSSPGTAPRAASPAENPLGEKFQVAIIDAEIQPFSGDYRAALEEMRRLESALKALPRAEVSVVAQPVDLGSNLTLSGRGGATNAPAASARFALRLVTALAAP